MIKDVFKRRFNELEDSFSQIKFEKSEYSGLFSQDGSWQGWSVSAQNLLKAVFEENSPHYTRFVQAYDECNRQHGGISLVSTLQNIFLSAKEDFEADCVFDVDLRISGEVFGDFVALARQSMLDGHKDVAAVLACAALEDALKRYAAINLLDVNDKTMQEVVNSLKTKGLVAGAQKTLLDAMPKIRNLAMHAEWSKISEPDVSSVLGFVEQFLLTKFSPN
ncbi:MAG TPA: DUF4145 domain-containing protein [Burkholderiaceae bacterium]|nr:DUF4145 domain-containing protein [Burkholderiaceae bacterium]